MNINDWPNCPTPDCENKICLWANSGLCYKCSEAVYGKEEMKAQYNRTYDVNGRLNDDVEGID